MPEKMRRILKADEVTFDDPLPLGLDPAVPSHGRESPCTSAGPSVRVAQNHSEYAVLEVTCPCGRTTYIRCDYGTANPSPARRALVPA